VCSFARKGQSWILDCDVNARDESVVDLADAVCGEEEKAFEVFHAAKKCCSHIVSAGLSADCRAKVVPRCH
jgi:hypothetical protein